MNLTNVLNYLKEELTDIPANVENVHYTNLPALISILKSGKIKPQFYHTNTGSKNEIATARPTKTNVGRDDLSNFIDNVKISLYTKRILSGARGVTKKPIAEYPKERMVQIRAFKNQLLKYGIKELPNFSEDDFKDWDSYKSAIKDFSSIELKVRNWLKKQKDFDDLGLPSSFDAASGIICLYFRRKYLMKQEVMKREGEERFITKDGIPVDPKFMRIEFISAPKEEFLDSYNVEANEDDDTYKRCVDAITTLKKTSPELVVRNKYFDDVITRLKKFAVKAQFK